MFPLIKNFKEDTIINTFVLIAICHSILFSLSLATHRIIEKTDMNEFFKWLTSVLYIFFITLFSYIIMYLIFGYSAGGLDKKLI